MFVYRFSKHRLTIPLIALAIFACAIGELSAKEAKTFKVAAVQAVSRLGDVQWNRRHLEGLVRQAAKNGAKVIVLPETSVTGYMKIDLKKTWQVGGRRTTKGIEGIDPSAVAETVPGESTRFFAKLAGELKVYLTVPLLEVDRRSGNYYNTVVLISPDTTYCGYYRKLNPWPFAERAWATKGDLGHVFVDTPYGRMGLLICFDINFEPPALKKLGVDHLLYPIAWVEDEGSTWFEKQLPAIAKKNNLNIIGANWTVPAGYKPKWHGYGQSRIIDRAGKILAKVKDDRAEEIVYAELPIAGNGPKAAAQKPAAKDGNGVSEEKNLPGELRDADLLWSMKSGTHQYSAPIFKDGRIYLGLNDQTLKHAMLKKTGGGVVMCLDAVTREMVWQVVIPRYMEGTKAPFHFNHWRCGVCSTPAMEDEYMYIVGPRGDVLCLDRAGLADGNDGPFKDEAAYMGYADGAQAKLAETDGDIVWRFDMIRELGVVPHDVCGSSPVLCGDYLYVCTSNGQDDQHKYVVNPQAPSLIVLNKRTGRLAAADGELIGKRIFHGLWSSPVVAKIKGSVMILYGAGDGVLYAFESAAGDEAGTLKKIWQRDCNPEAYRAVGYTNSRQKSSKGPSEIIATPVVYNGRIYVAIGQSPIHGKGQGALSCIDPGTGEIVWQSQLVDRSLCTVSATDGLVYIADYSGNLHCFDAATGKRYWVHDLGAGVWSASTFIADGKVYIGTEGNVFWVLRAGKEKEVLSRQRVDSMPITVTADKGVLYVPTQKSLLAYKMARDN